MISQKSIQEVLETAKVEDVINEYVNLKRRGANMIGLCPFHNEKTPSFMVSPVKNIFKCFGCGQGGDATKFMMEHEGLSFPEAIKDLAVRYNIQIEETETSHEDQQTKFRNESLFLVNNYARDYYKKVLLDDPMGKAIGLSYFKERGFLEATIKKFDLGFSLAQKDQFTRTAIGDGQNIELLRDLGLTTKYDSDFFKDRVMFPIKNLSGKVIAFAGRTLKSDKKIPKYINSPETEIYVKRKNLYGLYYAKQAIRKANACFLVEGYTDVISLHQNGVENVVSSSGTSLTEEQIRLIKRYCEKIIILYDGDPAGIKAALRGLDMIVEQDLDVQLVLLPEGEDPDSYITKTGAAGFSDYIEKNAKDFVLFKANLLAKEAGNDPIKRTKLIKDIVQTIAKIPDQIKRALYIKESSHVLDIDEVILNEEANKVIRLNHKTQQIRNKRGTQRQYQNEIAKPKLKEVHGRQNTKEWTDEYQEKDLIRLLIMGGAKPYDEEKNITIAQYVINNTRDIVESFDNALYKKIYQFIEDRITNNLPIDYNIFIHHEDEAIKDLAINILSSPYEYANWESKEYFLQTQAKPEENFVKDSSHVILRLKERKFMKTKNEIEQRLKTMSSDNDDYYLLIKAYQKLKDMITIIQKQLGTVIPSKR